MTFVNHLFDNDMFVINSGIVYVCAVCLPLGQPCLSVKPEDIIMVTHYAFVFDLVRFHTFSGVAKVRVNMAISPVGN